MLSRGCAGGGAGEARRSSTRPLGTVLTGAAPAWVGARLAQPPHVGTVIHAGSDAIYVSSYDDVLGVVSRHATSLPCTISTRLHTLDGALGEGGRPMVGDDVTIGFGVIDFGTTTVGVGRYIDFAMPTFNPAGVEPMKERLDGLIGTSSHPTELDASLLSMLAARPTDALMLTLGRGSGLTPFGDDVVCGMIAILVAGADPCADGLCERAVALAPERTTSLSATLLRRAALGEALPAFADVVSALIENPNNAAARISQLLRIGHSSGAGMLLGLHLALEHIIKRSCCS